MVLWALLAVLTFLAVLAVLVPLARAGSPARAANDADLAVYRDQLAEIERDVTRGILGAGEAEAARAEVARRLIAVEARDAAESATLTGAAPRWASVGVIVLVPALSLAFYLLHGSPHLPGQPLQARSQVPIEDQDIASLVTRVEAHLAENPEDGRGFEVLAPVYLRLGRPEEAVRAWHSAIRLLGATPERQAELGEALVVAADGMVDADARAAFEAALQEAPEAVKPRYFLAIAAEQEGAWETAVERWRALVDDAAEDAPWRAAATERLARAEEAAGSDAPGPDAEEIAAAEQMAPQTRDEMIRGMVEGLAARLAADGDDLQGWLRLARSYVVLGETDQARAALDAARRHFAEDAGADATIRATAEELGL